MRGGEVSVERRRRKESEMKADFRGSQSPVNTREGKRTSIPAPDGDVAIRVPDETLIVRSPIGRGGVGRVGWAAK